MCAFLEASAGSGRSDLWLARVWRWRVRSLVLSALLRRERLQLLIPGARQVHDWAPELREHLLQWRYFPWLRFVLTALAGRQRAAKRCREWVLLEVSPWPVRWRFSLGSPG